MKVLWIIRNRWDYYCLSKSLQLNLQQDFVLCTSLFTSNMEQVFSSPNPHPHLFFKPHSFLEQYFKKGELDYSFLKKDLKAIQEAIQAFQPDRICSLGRFSAFIAAEINHLPHYFLYEPELDKNSSSHNLWKGLNRLLKESNLPQILQYSDLSNYGKAFSFQPNESIRLVQGSLLYSNHILIEANTSYRSLLTNSLEDYKEIQENQLMTMNPRLVIHQENLYLFQLCKEKAIPQLILPKTTFFTPGCYLYLDPEECNPEQIQEAVQYALHSQRYQLVCQKEKTNPKISLSSLLK